MSTTANSHRAWCFTLNNYSEIEKDRFQNIECNYIVFGKEYSEDGTPHLQGCIRFSRTYRLSGLKKNISSRAHWEPAKDFEASVNYCMKEDPEPFIKDNRKQGQRTDLDLACETVKTGGIYQLARDSPAVFVKYHGGFAKLATMFQTTRKSKPHVVWIYGDTGTGKTRQVHEKEDSLFVAHANHQWWDGYRQQDAILIDDMRAGWAPFNILLKILDRYQMQVPVKGGFVELNSPRIYITSQFPPQEVYNREHRSGEDIAQLLRRLGEVVCLRQDPAVRGSVITSSLDLEELLQQDRRENSASFVSGFRPPPAYEAFLRGPWPVPGQCSTIPSTKSITQRSGQQTTFGQHPGVTTQDKVWPRPSGPLPLRKSSGAVHLFRSPLSPPRPRSLERSSTKSSISPIPTRTATPGLTPPSSPSTPSGHGSLKTQTSKSTPSQGSKTTCGDCTTEEYCSECLFNRDPNQDTWYS